MTPLQLITGKDAQALLRLYGITQTEYGHFLTRYLDEKHLISRQTVSFLLYKYSDNALPVQYRNALQALLEQRTTERWEQ
jgi:hypothetical protein